ncbi:MAG: PA14 domain-containing protein, partial [Candidatus Hydrogenedentales bacterium]
YREGGPIAKYKEDIQSLRDVVNVEQIPPVDVSNPAAGLAFKCYEGLWTSLPDFSTLQPVEQGITPEINLNATARKEQFALVFEGYAQAPADGMYVFYCKSNDGSRLSVGGKVLIDNDGQHGEISKPGAIVLKAGFYPIRVEYFESGGSETLEVLVEGPGIERQPVPATSLFHAGG